MNQAYTLLRKFWAAILLALPLGAWAQPANNSCATATPVAPTSCTAGTTVGADDSWIGSVGCQSGGNHNDVWYSFVATQNQLNINVTTAGLGNNVEFVLAESPCGNCSCSFIIGGSVCGPAPLVDSIIGLNIGATYYFTVSSSGADGAFNACITNLAAVNRPGQDCATASNVCDMDPFGQPSVASGNGAVRGIGSQEDVNALSCFGSDERQSQWYTFTCSRTGTIEFNINPNVSSDDYDFLLLDITTSGCNLLSGPATVVACNWSGCKGSTGITSAVASEPGLVTSGAGCFGGPAAWVTTPPTITACREYLLLIDNFSLSNNGFTFTWGGATSGMTGRIGPAGATGFTTAMNSSSPCRWTPTSTSVLPCYTYSWTWGDGTTSVGANPGGHTYPGPGPWTITQTITDPNGCEAVISQNVSCLLPAEETSLRAIKAGEAVALELVLAEGVMARSYVIEHSADGVNFAPIVSREGLNDPDIDTYKATHLRPVTGMNFYRATVQDLDGGVHNTQTVELTFMSEGNTISLLPNPAKDQVSVSIYAGAPGEVQLQLLDAQGRIVRNAARSTMGEELLQFDVPLDDLAAGAYFVRLRTASGTHTRMLMKQ